MVATTNVLIALKNILNRNSSILTPIFRSNGSVNAAGDSLEYFVKDMFCTGASQYQYEHEKQKIYDNYLSWSGNSSNFPDFIIKGGVGVEPKKLNNKSQSNLALNSSYPKDYIYPDSQNLPNESLLKEDEAWARKEVVYIAGNLDKDTNKLYSLWMAYGNTFVADRATYLSLIDEIREAIKHTNATLTESKELARARGIDPLGYSNLRVRGMYELQHPATVFSQYTIGLNVPEESTKIYLIMLKNDYEALLNIDGDTGLEIFYETNKLFKQEIKISDPNNTDMELEAVLFCGYTD